MRSTYEKQTEKILKESGFITDYKARPKFTPRGYNVDYFGLFDLMAYKDGEIHLIAIKGHQGVPGALRLGIKKFGVKKIIKEIWTYKKNGTIKKEII